MFNVSIFFFFQSIFAVTIIFWVLSIIGEKYFKTGSQEYSREIFECGFFTINQLNLRFNFNFFVLGLLLLIYDIEFFLLIPFFFNIYSINFLMFWVAWLFVSSLLLSLIFDWRNTFYTNWLS